MGGRCKLRVFDHVRKRWCGDIAGLCNLRNHHDTASHGRRNTSTCGTLERTMWLTSTATLMNMLRVFNHPIQPASGCCIHVGALDLVTLPRHRADVTCLWVTPHRYHHHARARGRTYEIGTATVGPLSVVSCSTSVWVNTT